MSDFESATSFIKIYMQSKGRHGDMKANATSTSWHNNNHKKLEIPDGSLAFAILLISY